MGKRVIGLVMILGMLCLAMGAAEAGTTLRLGHTDPPDGLRHKASLLFADKVKEYTQGRYSVDAHHSSTLGDDPKLLEQVKLGAIDFAVTGVGIYSNQVPELGLLALPYLVESYEQGWQLFDTSSWAKEWFAKLQTKNIRYLAMWEAGFRQLTAKKRVLKPEDVKGMKIRISKNEMYLWIWSTLGANPTVMALGETYISLQQGVVDAQENPIATIRSMSNLPIGVGFGIKDAASAAAVAAHADGVVVGSVLVEAIARLEGDTSAIPGALTAILLDLRNAMDNR